MNNTAAACDPNPFASRNLRPGAIEFLFPAGGSAEALLDRLAQRGWWGAIVGPHGSGKSTLLATLEPLLATRGRRIVRYTLRAGERRLPLNRAEAAAWDATTQVIVDGYEQLGWLARCWLHAACRRRGCGLLVTAHQPLRIPTLLRTEVSPELAQRVAERIAGRAIPLQSGELAQLLSQTDGNLREVLFCLYDLYESRRS
jgi:hypothetical protein